jgi:hypothetical protein
MIRHLTPLLFGVPRRDIGTRAGILERWRIRRTAAAPFSPP